MYASVHRQVSERLMHTLRHLIVDRRIRRHLCTPLTECPLFRRDQKLPTYPFVSAVLSHVPAFDKAYRV